MMPRVTPSIAALLLALVPSFVGAVPKPGGVPGAASKPLPLPKTQVLEQPKIGDTIDLSDLEPDRQLARLPVGRDPRMSALALAALRNFANGGASTDPVDKAVGVRMSKLRNGRKIAKRILARIDRLAKGTRDAAFGPADHSGDATTTLLAAVSAGAVSPLYNGIGLTSPNALPAEGALPPSSFALNMTGLATLETSDADQDGDEVVVLSTFVRMPSNAGFSIVHSSAADATPLTGLDAGEVTPLDRSIYTGGNTDALLVTAAFEVDGDDAAAREDYLAMVALAEPLAVQLFQATDTIPTRLTRFAFALDYTVGLLAAAEPSRWPQGVLQKTTLGPSGTGFPSLSATPASTDGAVQWKLAHHHDLPAGDYTVYFDVPAATAPNQPNVKVKITHAESLSPEGGGDDLTLELGIDGPSKTKKLPANTNVHDLSWTVQRLVNPGMVAIRISLGDLSPGPASGYIGQAGNSQKCGDWPNGESYGACPEFYRALDLDLGATPKPGDPQGKVVVLQLNTQTGKITGPGVNGDVGDTLTVKGLSFPLGKVKLVVTVD